MRRWSVEARIFPVAKVTVYPRGDDVSSSHASSEVGGAGEGLEQESVAWCQSCVDATSAGWDHVVALLVVVVAKYLWLWESRGQHHFLRQSLLICRTASIYNLGEPPLLQQPMMIAENSLVVDGGIERRRRSNGISSRRSRQSCGSC